MILSNSGDRGTWRCAWWWPAPWSSRSPSLSAATAPASFSPGRGCGGDGGGRGYGGGGSLSPPPHLRRRPRGTRLRLHATGRAPRRRISPHAHRATPPERAGRRRRTLQNERRREIEVGILTSGPAIVFRKKIADWTVTCAIRTLNRSQQCSGGFLSGIKSSG